MSIKYQFFRVSKAISRRVFTASGRICKRCEYDTALKKRLKLIGGGYRGSGAEFKETVVKYWKPYGIKPDRNWYALLCAGRDAYEPRFIPDPIWFMQILPYFNDKKMQEAYGDKGMFSRILPDVKKPDTVVKRMGGYYFDGDGEHMIGREEAEALCAREESLIFKPFRGRGGAGITFYDREKDGAEGVKKLFDLFRGGFVAQRIVRQHPDLERLNPTSLNTVRVMSFHFKGEVHILSAQLRIGGKGARVDNVCAGGSACSIYPTGWLHEKSVTRKSQWTDETESGIKLASIRVPHYEDVCETVKRLHRELPYFNLIGWDFAVGEDGTPILTEFNIGPGQNQIGDRAPTFGDMTEEVLEDVFVKKSLKHAFDR